jgi:hypothetical protein
MPTLLPLNTPQNTTTLGDTKIYVDPRISANLLAQFMISDHAKQEAIVRNAKRMNKIMMANYQPGRVAVSACYDGAGINVDHLRAKAEHMKTSEFSDDFETQCNRLSGVALEKLAEIAPGINCAGVKVPRPHDGYRHMLIENVRVSVQPEIVFTAQHRGQTKYGGIMVNFTKGDSTSYDKKQGRYFSGDYAAFLVFLMLGLHYGSTGVRNTSCFAVDIYRQAAYSGTTAHVTMLKNIEAACRNIARQWDEV